MRSTLLLAALAVIALHANAQNKGFLSGQLSFSNTTVSGSEGGTSALTIGPVAGYNLSERIVLGVGVNYGGTTITNEAISGNQTYDLKTTTGLFTTTPFMRYMKKVDEDFSVYGQLAFGIGFGKNEHEYLSYGTNGTTKEKNTSDVTAFNTAIGPGVLYTFAPRWAISADWGALRYESRTVKPDEDGADETTVNTFGISLNASSLTFGLNWLF